MMGSRGTGVSVCQGVSVLEAVVSLVLGILLMTLTLSVLSSQRDVVAGLARRAESLATLRTVRVVLRREARASGSVPWRAFSDSVALRAYRGAGSVCGSAEGRRVLMVSSWGVRAPDPAKDSVVVVTEGGDVFSRKLQRLDGGGACRPGAPAGVQRWTLSEAVPSEPLLVRYFEHGSYHLSAGAFRYRRGAAGRQPLTPEALLTPESRFFPTSGGLRALLFLRGPSSVGDVDLLVRGPPR